MSGPFPDDETLRLECLVSYDILDTPAEEAFDDITWLASTLCGTPISLISLIDQERQWFKSRVGVNLTETGRDVAFCAHTILAPDGMVVLDAAEDPRFRSHPAVTGPPYIRFYAGAPLITASGHALGSLCVADFSPREFSAEQQRVLRTLARQVVAQLELRKVIRDQGRMAEQQRRFEQDLIDANSRLQASEARLAEAQNIAQMGSWELDALSGDIHWSDSMFQIMDFDPGAGAPDYEAVRLRCHVADRQKVDRILQDARTDGEPCEFDFRIVRNDGTLRWLHTIGRATLDETGRPIRLTGTVRDTTTAKLLADQLEAANRHLEAVNRLLVEQQAELVAGHEQLEALAASDGLTGLKNHQAFQGKLEEEYERSRRYKSSLSLLLLDVDHFKRFNDTFGHPAGDQALKQVAAILAAAARTSDFVARYGGEEFAVILPETDADGAATIAERIRRAIETEPWLQRTLTVSVGVSSLDPFTPSASALLDAADRALYSAKAGGRNCVRMWADLDTEYIA